MFEAVMTGTPVAEAIARYVETLRQQKVDDIELF
jgi:hypothetical protein